jgi:hypothetical protein
VLGFAAGNVEAHSPWEVYAGYGNGAHDLAPHWHETLTPYGPVYWYGNGPHDLLPHEHTVSPWDGVRSYHYTPLGPTRSFNGQPYYGGYYGGYTPYYGGYYGGW